MIDMTTTIEENASLIEHKKQKIDQIYWVKMSSTTVQDGNTIRQERGIAATYTRPMVVDLCLYSYVTERCGGQVLPFGVRQMIKDYAWASFL